VKFKMHENKRRLSDPTGGAYSSYSCPADTVDYNLSALWASVIDYYAFWF